MIVAVDDAAQNPIDCARSLKALQRVGPHQGERITIQKQSVVVVEPMWDVGCSNQSAAAALDVAEGFLLKRGRFLFWSGHS